jgi:uncharacterized protein (DUF1697 family)
MTRFVAFLRGINVGGRVVKKEQLAEAFVSLGFQDISTFMQSGNVLFTTTDADAEALKAQIEAKLHDVLGFEVAVFIRTITQLKEIIAKAPFQNQPSGGTSYLVTLLENPAPPAFTATLPLTIPKSTAQILCANGTEIYSETHGGGEGALPNPYVESKLKVKATTRNLNVIRAIVEKCSEDQN